MKLYIGSCVYIYIYTHRILCNLYSYTDIGYVVPILHRGMFMTISGTMHPGDSTWWCGTSRTHEYWMNIGWICYGYGIAVLCIFFAIFEMSEIMLKDVEIHVWDRSSKTGMLLKAFNFLCILHQYLGLLTQVKRIGNKQPGTTLQTNCSGF